MRPIPEIPADQENFRFEPTGIGRMMRVRRDPVMPVPVGTVIAFAFRVTGYDPDCDGSLMVRAEAVAANDEATGWEIDSIGLYPGTAVVLEDASELHKLATDMTTPAVDQEEV